MQGLAALAALARAVPSDAKDLLHVNCPHKFCSFSDEVASQGQARWQCFSEASPLRPRTRGATALLVLCAPPQASNVITPAIIGAQNNTAESQLPPGWAEGVPCGTGEVPLPRGTHTPPGTHPASAPRRRRGEMAQSQG